MEVKVQELLPNRLNSCRSRQAAVDEGVSLKPHPLLRLVYCGTSEVGVEVPQLSAFIRSQNKVRTFYF